MPRAGPGTGSAILAVRASLRAAHSSARIAIAAKPLQAARGEAATAAAEAPLPDHLLEHLHGKAAVRGEKMHDAFRLAAAGAIFVLAAYVSHGAETVSPTQQPHRELRGAERAGGESSTDRPCHEGEGRSWAIGHLVVHVAAPSARLHVVLIALCRQHSLAVKLLGPASDLGSPGGFAEVFLQACVLDQLEGRGAPLAHARAVELDLEGRVEVVLGGAIAGGPSRAAFPGKPTAFGESAPRLRGGR